MPRLLVLCFSLLVLFLTALAQADTVGGAQQAELAHQQLEQTQKDIDKLQQLLRQIEQEKSDLQKKLKDNETNMGTLEQQIRELKQHIHADESALEQLEHDQQRLQQSYRAQQQRIARQSRVLWQNGGQSAPLRLLLSAEQPATMARTLTYYRYLGQARQREIDSLNATLLALEQVRQKTLARKAQLNQQQQTLDTRHQQLSALQKKRQGLLSTLNQQKQSRTAQLKARQQEQEDLSRVLQALQTALAQRTKAEQTQQNLVQISQSTIANRPFAQARGQLPWPVNGQLLAQYGSPRGTDNRVRWDGVLIGAAEGSIVRAIHPGQVVLADYLSGMGLMLIINHGSQYLSLYGHNQSLLKRKGDLVQAGEAIATVGKSGGQAESALYFAIRHQKTPSDPAQWCIAQKKPK